VDNLFGGSATADDFDIELNGAGVIMNLVSTAGTVTTYATDEIEVDAGLQEFSEIDVAGYIEGSWSCSRTAPSAAGPVASGDFYDGSLDIANGETWECEITNTEEAPPTGTETAWAANELNDCCTLLFNPNGGGWATYVDYTAGGTKTVGLYAGQFTKVGEVTFAPENGQVKIRSS
jgi:hypothetical protein